MNKEYDSLLMIEIEKILKFKVHAKKYIIIMLKIRFNVYS